MNAQYKHELEVLENNVREISKAISEYKISIYEKYFERQPSLELIKMWADEGQNSLLELENVINEYEKGMINDDVSEIKFLVEEIGLRRA